MTGGSWARLAARIELLAAAWMLAQPAHADEKWRFTLGTTTDIVDVAVSGAQLSFTLQGLPFSGPLGALSVPASPPERPCPAVSVGAAFSGSVSPDGHHLRTALATGFNPPSCTLPTYVAFNGDRCGCFDGNSVDGDGCSAACQVEPCFTCSGEPSVCTPAGDGAACDDGRVCTSGETCSAGVCGGGAPIGNCHDVSGRWMVRLVSEFGTDYLLRTYEQYGNFIAGDGFTGNIDVATGAFTQNQIPSSLAAFLCPVVTATGQLAADDSAFEANGLSYAFTMTCHEFPFALFGSRCGNGVLDADEECDDGNLGSGDRCSAACQVEPCSSCSGEPSSCTPLPNGTPCDDGDACTGGSVCTELGCLGFAPVSCDACLACDPDAGCIAAPRADCVAASRSTAVLSASATAGADKLSWRWLRGGALDLAALGSPTTITNYDVCIYDESGPTPNLLLHAAAPGGAGWRANGSGFSYRGTDVRALTLKSGIAGKSKAVLKLKGDLPTPPFGTPLTVQVQGAAAACVTTTFDAADVSTNTPTRFKASR
jgi:cysteine-rich repeat protein